MSAADAAPPDDEALGRAASNLAAALRSRTVRLAVAESCTGGWIAKVLTDVPGASDWLDSGYVTYSNRAKTAALGVPETVLAGDGAVSEAAVRAMVQGLRRYTGAEAALAVSGIAGPGGGSRAKPVGTVHFAFSLNDREWHAHRLLAGDREAVRRRSVAFALEQMTEALRSEPRA